MPVSAVMTSKDIVTGPVGTTLEKAQALLQEHRIEKLPIVDKDNRLMGLITVKDIEKKIRYPNAAKDSRGRLLVGVAIGFEETLLERATACIKAGADVLAMDSAHGHSLGIMRSLEKLREAFPDVPLIAGNVISPEVPRPANGCESACRTAKFCWNPSRRIATTAW